MANVDEKILRYKKYLDRYQEDKSRRKEVYQILRKLDKLPVTLDHLQSTGIGKAVNSYRKYDDEIGNEAKAIVAKWKCLVPGIKTEQPSTSIQCETISETSYHSSDSPLEHHAPLPSTQRAPYLESGKTPVIPSASIINAGNSNCDTDDEMCCDKVNGDNTATGDKCCNHNGVESKMTSDHGLNGLQEESKLEKSRSKDKKQKDKDKEHSSVSQKHSKHSRHSTKEGSRKSKNYHCLDVNSVHLSDHSEENKSSSQDKESSPHGEHSSQSYKDGFHEGTSLIDHKSSSSKERTSSNQKTDLHQVNRSDHKTNSDKESRSGHKSSTQKESGIEGHKNSSQKDRKEHKSSRHKKHRSKDSGSSNEKSSKEKLTEINLKAKTANENQSPGIHPSDQEATLDNNKTSDRVCQNLSSPNDKKLGAFKEKLSRFSDSLKKVGGIMPENSASEIEPKLHQSRHSPLLAEKLNDELLNDVLMNDEDFNDLPKENESAEKTKANTSNSVHSTKRKPDANNDEPNSKKIKLNSNMDCGSKNSDNEGLSFEELMTFDEKLLRKQAKKQKTSSHGQHSTGSHHSSKTKQSDASSKDKSHRHGTSSTKSHSDHRSSSREKSASASRHKPSKDSVKVSELTGNHDAGMAKPGSELKSSKRKEMKFSVPQAPDKKMKLTDIDILGGLAEATSNNHMLSQPRIKDVNKSNKESSPEDDFLGKRNTRTQVYSGKRTNTVHEIPKLRDACLRVLMDNIDDIENVGNVPFEVLRPVLERCSSSQLYTIEEYNPQFVKKTCNLWEKLCRKDFRNEKPAEFESWRELYLRKHDEREARLKRLTTNIAVSFAKKQEPVKKTKLAFVDSVAKPPRNVLRQQRKHGTAGLVRGLDPLSKTRKQHF